jgi:hypothetical protein
MANLPKAVLIFNMMLIKFTVTFYRIVSQLLRSKGVRWMVAILFAGKLFLLFIAHFYPKEFLVPFLKLLVPEPLFLWYFLPPHACFPENALIFLLNFRYF